MGSTKRLFRFTIAGMIGAVASFGVIFAWLVNPTELLTWCVLSLTLVTLLTATLVALRGAEPGRTFWLGFALFGWTYATLSFNHMAEPAAYPLLPTPRILTNLYRHFHFTNYRLLSYETVGTFGVIRGTNPEPLYFHRMGHSFLAIIFGLMGGFIARVVARSDPREVNRAASTP